jgi:hypothetical protein
VTTLTALSKLLGAICCPPAHLLDARASTDSHSAPKSDGAVALSGSFWKAGAGVEILKSAREGGPISLVANSCAALGHLDLRSGLSSVSYKPWISVLLKRSSSTCSHEGFRRPQLLDSVTDGLTRRCEPPVVLAAILGALCQEEFCRERCS